MKAAKITKDDLTLAGLQSFGPITLTQRINSGWSVSWSLQWDFAEALDAVEMMGVLIGIERETAKYRVRVIIENERQPKKAKA